MVSQQPQSDNLDETMYCVAGGTKQDMPHKYESQTSQGRMERYSMCRKPAGTCLIISNEDFSETRTTVSEGFQDRPGTEVDAKNLSVIFEWLGFVVEIKRNVKAIQLWNALLGCKNKDHSTSDCLVICILSHGKRLSNNDHIYGTDGKPIEAAHVFSLFNGASCPSLVDKPKLFFLQCCRGTGEDSGILCVGENQQDGSSSDALPPVSSDFFIG